MFSVPGHPVPLLLAPQEDNSATPVARMITYNKIFFIMWVLFDCISNFALQIYITFALSHK